MQAGHRVIAHPDRDLIHITLSGFFGAGEVEQFNRDRMAGHAALRCGPNRHLTLVDVREMKIQAQDILKLFRRMIADPATRSRRLALVTGAAAVRMQVRRLIERDDVACFADPFEAEAWLAGDAEDRKLAG